MLRIALIHDYAEERWLSMDLVGEMLQRFLEDSTEDQPSLHVESIRPRMPRLARRLPFGYTVDRFIGRFVHYPRHLQSRHPRFDIFHLVDHSYGQLVHSLPSGRCIVTCHDLDTFRSILTPDEAPRSLPFRLMTGRILSGFRKAARIHCVSATVRDELATFAIVPPERIRVIPNGIHPEFLAESGDHVARQVSQLLEKAGCDRVPLLLHVGSTIARKNIEGLLHILSHVAKAYPEVRLIRVGGEMTASQRKLAAALGVASAVVTLPYVEAPLLAGIYRHVGFVLLPSASEGFGLPLVEALACGAVVVANDIPVLREVGGPAAVFAPASQSHQFAAAVVSLMGEREKAIERWRERQRLARQWASRFSWAETARLTRESYQDLATELELKASKRF